MDRVYLSSPNVIAVLDVFINHNYGFMSIGSRALTYKWSSLWCCLVLLCSFPYYSGLESMGLENKINGRFRWWGVQIDSLCWWSSNWETYHFEARGGMDRAIAVLSCAFEFLQWVPQFLGEVLWGMLKNFKSKMWFFCSFSVRIGTLVKSYVMALNSFSIK